MHKLIMLRGNSGSGKTTVAKELQELFGRETMVLSQDMIRRDILKARDGIDTPALPLIKEMLRYGSENCEVVIMEGIFVADWYRELFEEAIRLYGSDIYAYYFDIPFEETVRRHQTRSKAAEFGADEMRKWWVEKDYLDMIKETIITEEMSKDEIVSEIYSRDAQMRHSFRQKRLLDCEIITFKTPMTSHHMMHLPKAVDRIIEKEY